MISMKKLLVKILNAIGNAVEKTGDTMTGDLLVTKEDDAARVKVSTTDTNNATVADGQLSTTAFGSCGIYDNLHSKWIIRTDTSGATHVPLTASNIYSVKVACRRVSTTYSYTTIAELANWNIIGVRFFVNEVSHVLFFARPETSDRSLTDAPSSGRFRGTIFVDWANNRIGIRCLSAGSNNTYYNLVYFDRVYGVF